MAHKEDFSENVSDALAPTKLSALALDFGWEAINYVYINCKCRSNCGLKLFCLSLDESLYTT